MKSEKLGPYELLGVLGRGGMGTVYRAQHEMSREVVAVKALASSSCDDAHFRQRFESEIKALLKLDHPNIVRLLSYGQDQGILFFAMELVEGKSLFHLQREQRTFDWRRVLEIAKDVAAGLRHAHDRGIIHRDLKPGNLLQNSQGTIKITDFGIAKAFGVSNDTRDNVLGTIDFMSPEQALGNPVTVRSDLYSLGVVLYTLLSGQPPFAGNSIEQSLRNLTRVPAPRVRTKVANVPEPLDELLDELLRKKPDHRVQTALALMKRLEAIEQELKGTSEAHTQHGPAATGTPRDQSKSGAPPTSSGGAAKDRTRVIHPAVEPVTRVSSETAVVAQAEDIEIELAPPPPKPLDYFSTVTERVRRQIEEDERPAERPFIGKLFLLLAAFLAISGLLGWGIYRAMTPPTADELFAKIETAASTPDRIREELTQFIKHYSADERIEQVRRLNQIADSIAMYKRLALRRNLPGENRLTPLERQFVEIIDGAQDDPAQGYLKLTAFVRMHSGGELSEDEAALVAAAECFIGKIKDEARNKVSWDRQRIVAALERAAQNPPQAEEIYRAIILLYGDIDWARDLVEQAKQYID
ncbi:MAG TPA: serine/threonine-protein kinase [Pirellulaceae bacterium]|nr:serine/threonine-protein kinase [Pirellulaceae bacterium]